MMYTANYVLVCHADFECCCVKEHKNDDEDEDENDNNNATNTASSSNETPPHLQNDKNGTSRIIESNHEHNNYSIVLKLGKTTLI